jgi:hypothetical protein
MIDVFVLNDLRFNSLSGIFITSLISTALVGVFLKAGDANTNATPDAANSSSSSSDGQEVETVHYSRHYPYLFTFVFVVLTLFPLVR